MIIYTTVGAIRGRCGHKHRSVADAYRCYVRDVRECARRSGYSDRRVQRWDSEGRIVGLSDEEFDEIARLGGSVGGLGTYVPRPE